MIHLRSYTHFSAWESILRIPDLVQRAVENNHGSLAITDMGNMYGALEFYRECKKNGINPIIGQEIFLVEDASVRERGKSYRITLLAKNFEGYKNLMRISSLGFNNFYYAPRIDLEILAKHSDHLNCLVWDHIEQGANFNVEEMKNDLAMLDYAMNGSLLYEVRGDSSSHSINKFIAETYDKDSIVPTVPMRYARESDFKTHDMAYAIQADFTGRRKKQLRTNQFFYPTDDQLLSRLSYLGDISRYVSNADRIGEISKIDVPTEFKFPKYKNMSEEEAAVFITDISNANLFDKVSSIDNTRYAERLKYELGVVKKLGFSSYFLVVADIVQNAKRMGVEVGPGRGSVCGSVLAWVLGIHAIDPIKNELYFERFLNEDRVSMPDIDIDFDDVNRSKVIDYIAEEYGHSKVSQICTHSTIAMRGAIKDVARARGIDFETANLFSKTIPPKYITSEVREYDEVKDLLSRDNRFEEVLSYAEKLEGQFRQASVHAAAVVIAPDEITDFTPMQHIKGREATQYEMRGLEYCGLVKMDILGLRTLSVIKDCVKNAGNEKEIRKQMWELNDPQTLDLIRRGDTSGVFQIEDGGMAAMARDVRVSHFNDIAALVALYRPALIAGGLDKVYIENKQRIENGEEIESIHPIVGHTLDETYGVPLYQESLMRLAREMGGFSLKEADTLRKAVGKKDMTLLESLKEKFSNGAKEKGVEDDDIRRIWHDVFEAAGDYGFNKSHAVAYGSISYITAFLKRHHTLDFYCALLTSVQEESKKQQFQKYLEDVRKHRIPIVLPNINTSLSYCYHDDGKIHLSLACIKNIGEGFTENIVEERKNGEFTDIIDFCTRVNPDTTQLRYLIYAQAIPDGNRYLGSVDQIVSHCKKIRQEKEKVFAGGFDFAPVEKEFVVENHIEVSDNELEGFLFESIGFRGDFLFEEGVIYTTVTRIKTYKQWNTKKSKKEMAMITLDSYPAHQMLVFPNVFKAYKHELVKGKEVKIDFKWLEDMKLALVHAEEP